MSQTSMVRNDPPANTASLDRQAAPTRPLRLLLCDDHALFREGLAALLERSAEWQVVGEAATGNEAVRLAQELAPDVVVLDVGLPDITGVDAASAIQTAAPGCAVVAPSMYADGHYVRRMQEPGALAYVLKNDVSGELLQAIDAATRGKRYLSRTLRAGPDPVAEDAGPAPSGAARTSTATCSRPASARCSACWRAASGRRTSPTSSVSASRPSKPTAPASCTSSKSTTSRGWCASRFAPGWRRRSDDTTWSSGRYRVARSLASSGE